MRRTAAAMVLALVAATAGCGGDDAPASAPLTAAETTAGSSSPDAASDVTPFEGDPCGLLSAAEVEAATGLAVTGVEADPPLGCLFALDTDPVVRMFVAVEDGAGRLGGAANLFAEYSLLAGDGEAEWVAGLGEAAVCCPFRTIAVDAGGGRFVAVGVSGGYHVLAEPAEALTELGELAAGRL